MKKHLDQQFFCRVLSGVFISIFILVIWAISSPVESANAAPLYAPNITFLKNVASGMYPTGNPNEYVITYEIVVTNDGTNGSYTLVDTPQLYFYDRA